MKRLTSLSPGQSEQPGSEANAELAAASLAPPSPPAEAPAQPGQLHSTGNIKQTSLANFFSWKLSNILDESAVPDQGKLWWRWHASRRNQYCREGVVLTDSHRSTSLTNKQLKRAWSGATVDMLHCHYSRPVPSTERSVVRAPSVYVWA